MSDVVFQNIDKIIYVLLAHKPKVISLVMYTTSRICKVNKHTLYDHLSEQHDELQSVIYLGTSV